MRLKELVKSNPEYLDLDVRLLDTNYFGSIKIELERPTIANKIFKKYRINEI